MKFRQGLIFAAMLAFGATVCGANFSFEPTSAYYIDDVTRVEGNIVGISHTSAKIDSIAVILFSGERVTANDIDGVDFRRYFQWEEEPYIEVEIDFPATFDLKQVKQFQFYP